jgi:hypothetical protein
VMCDNGFFKTWKCQITTLKIVSSSVGFSWNLAIWCTKLNPSLIGLHLCGSLDSWWMYCIQQMNEVLKAYVRNMACLKASTTS